MASAPRRVIWAMTAVILLAATIECKETAQQSGNAPSRASAGSKKPGEPRSQAAPESKTPAAKPDSPASDDAPKTSSKFDRFQRKSRPVDISGQDGAEQEKNSERSATSGGKSDGKGRPVRASRSANAPSRDAWKAGDESNGTGSGDDSTGAPGARNDTSEPSSSQTHAQNGRGKVGSSEADPHVEASPTKEAPQSQGQRDPIGPLNGDSEDSTKVKARSGADQNGFKESARAKSQSSSGNSLQGKEGEAKQEGDEKGVGGEKPKIGGGFREVESQLKKEPVDESSSDIEKNNDAVGSYEGTGALQSFTPTGTSASETESAKGDAKSSDDGETSKDAGHFVGVEQAEAPEAGGVNSDEDLSAETRGQAPTKLIPDPVAKTPDSKRAKPKKTKSLLVGQAQRKEAEAPQVSDGVITPERDEVGSGDAKSEKEFEGGALKESPPGDDDFKALSKATEKNAEENSTPSSSTKDSAVAPPSKSKSTPDLVSNGGEKRGNAILALPPLKPKANGPVIEPFKVIVNGVNNVTVVDPPGTPSRAQIIKYAAPPPAPIELKAGGSCGPERWSKNHYAHARHGVLNDGAKNVTAHNMECCRLCRDNPACRSWTRVKLDQPLKKAGECWLFNHVPRRRYAKWADSGVSPEHEAQGRIVCDAGNYELGIDRPSKRGLINEGQRTFTATDHDCCMKCRLRSNCRSWTRITNTTAINQVGECWMRDWVPPTKDCKHCTTGVTRA